MPRRVTAPRGRRHALRPRSHARHASRRRANHGRHAQATTAAGRHARSAALRQGTPKQTATKRVAARSKSPAPKKPARARRAPRRAARSRPRRKRPAQSRRRPSGSTTGPWRRTPWRRTPRRRASCRSRRRSRRSRWRAYPRRIGLREALHFGAVAALVVAPLSLVFFNFVENLSVPAKLFDLVVGGPVLNVGFVAALGLLRGQSLVDRRDGVVGDQFPGSRSCWRRTRSGCRRVLIPAGAVLGPLVRRRVLRLGHHPRRDRRLVLRPSTASRVKLFRRGVCRAFPSLIVLSRSLLRCPLGVF